MSESEKSKVNLIPYTNMVDRGDGFPTWESYTNGMSPELIEKQLKWLKWVKEQNESRDAFERKHVVIVGDEMRFGYDGVFNMSEINVRDFFDRIFTRSWIEDKNNPDPYEFEGIGCKEYLDWREQKNKGVKNIDYSQYSMWRYNPIVLYRERKKNSDEITNKHYLVLKDDDEVFSFIKGRYFALSSPISYVGRSRYAKNARYLFAFAIDLDGVGVSQMKNIFYQQVEGGNEYMPSHAPIANIIVNSGHGVHLYYILDKPIPLYRENIKLLENLKTCLTSIVWNDATSTLDKIQFQGIFQGFRLPGTQTKFGSGIRAYENEAAKLFSIAELNKFTTDLNTGKPLLTPAQIEQLEGGKRKVSKVTLKGASEQYPEWYERVIVQGIKSPKKWHINRALYDWWLRRLRDPKIKDPKDKDSILVGHRYFCILTLAIYANKCDVPFEELKKDAMSLLERMDALTDSEDNQFTEQDIKDALSGYKLEYNTFPRNSIEYLTGMRFPVNRRNGRKQEVHLRRIRALQEIDDPEGNWHGRKAEKKVPASKSPAAKLVKQWRKENPHNLNKSRCAKDCGLNRDTVAKWWGDELTADQIVLKWQMLNYGNKNKSQCARETGLSRPTINKYWNEKVSEGGRNKADDNSEA